MCDEADTGLNVPIQQIRSDMSLSTKTRPGSRVSLKPSVISEARVVGLWHTAYVYLVEESPNVLQKDSEIASASSEKRGDKLRSDGDHSSSSG